MSSSERNASETSSCFLSACRASTRMSGWPASELPLKVPAREGNTTNSRQNSPVIRKAHSPFFLNS